MPDHLQNSASFEHAKGISGFQDVAAAVTCLPELVTLNVQISHVGQFIKGRLSASKLAAVANRMACYMSAMPFAQTNVELIACICRTTGLNPYVTRYNPHAVITSRCGEKG